MTIAVRIFLNLLIAMLCVPAFADGAPEVEATDGFLCVNKLRGRVNSVEGVKYFHTRHESVPYSSFMMNDSDFAIEFGGKYGSPTVIYRGQAFPISRRLFSLVRGSVTPIGNEVVFGDSIVVWRNAPKEVINLLVDLHNDNQSIRAFSCLSATCQILQAEQEGFRFRTYLLKGHKLMDRMWQINGGDDASLEIYTLRDQSYEEARQKAKARYIRIRNTLIVSGGVFSASVVGLLQYLGAF